MAHRIKIFIDTNVLIGAFSYKFEKYNKGAKDYKALQRILKRYACSTSVLSVAQTISSKAKKQDKVKSFFLEEFKHLDFLPVTKNDVLNAFNMEGKKKNGEPLDVEDNIQFVVARDNSCKVVLTNNIRDFENYPQIIVYNSKNLLQEAV